MSRYPHLPCAACQRQTSCDWLIPVSIMGEQDTLLCDKDGCRECARCSMGIVEGEYLVRLSDGRLAHRECASTTLDDLTWPNMRNQQHETLEVDYKTFMEVAMADEKRKRRGRVPRNEKIAANEQQINRYEQRIIELRDEIEVLKKAAREEAARILAEAGVQ